MSTNWKGLDHAPVWFVYLKIAAPAFYPCLVLCLRGFYLSYVIPGGIGMFQVYCSITVDKVDLSAIYCYISTEPIFFSPRNVTVLNKDVIIWLYFERLWIFIDSPGLQDWFQHLLRLPPVLKVSAKWLKCEEDAEISSKINRQLIWTDHLCLAKMLASAFECLCGYCSCGKYHSPGGNIDDHTYQIWIGIIGRFIFTVQTIQSMAEVHWNLVRTLRWLRLSGAYFKCTPRHEQIVQV